MNPSGVHILPFEPPMGLKILESVIICVHVIDISRWGVSMQGFVSFLGYVMFGDKYLAKFSDPTGYAPFFLSKEECQERLDNLKRNGFVYQDTEKAVNEWPAD